MNQGPSLHALLAVAMGALSTKAVAQTSYGVVAAKAVAVALLVALPASAATGTPPTGQPLASTYSQQDLLKNWAFSVCLATVSKDAATRADAHAAAGAYAALGKQSSTAYDGLRKLVDAFAARRPAASTGAEPNTMRCIDLLRSPELDRLSAKLARGSK